MAQNCMPPLSLVPQPISLIDLHPQASNLKAEVIQGLQQVPKTLSPKFLYDKRGSELFDAICRLPEYYITRTEVAILQTYATEISQALGDCVLVEFGSGSSQKIKILLDTSRQLAAYVAIDISKQHLYESCQALVQDYPHLDAIAICADYTKPLQLPPMPTLQGKTRVAFFPGSTIGNLEPTAAVKFLRQVATLVGSQGGLLIGVDLKKSVEILEPAYDDSQGISAAFALNVLRRINRDLGANFKLSQFAYRAPYNPQKGCIEMQLVSLMPQVVQIADQAITLQAHESIHTEQSYKYEIQEFQALAQAAGFQAQAVWKDEQAFFSVHYLTLP